MEGGKGRLQVLTGRLWWAGWGVLILQLWCCSFRSTCCWCIPQCCCCLLRRFAAGQPQIYFKLDSPP